MSASMWLAAVLVALSGVSASGVFEHPDWVAAAVLFLLAIAASANASHSAGQRGFEIVRAASSTLLAALAIACSAPALLDVGTRFQRLEFLSPVVFGFARVLGARVELVDGVLYAQRGTLIPICTDWSKLGLLPWLWFAFATGVHMLFYRRTKALRAWLAAMGVAAAYLIVRYAVLVVLVLQHPEAGRATGAYPFAVKLFVESRWQTVTFLPLVLFLVRFVPWTAHELVPRGFRTLSRGRLACAVCLTLCGGIAWGVHVNLQPSGARKSGRVVVDELHSRQWSSALAPLDTHSYGRESVYNYTLLVRFLDQYFDVRVNADAQYTDESLADTDVLVIKTATVPFTARESDAIRAFVHRGGGLFVLGDHTDLLGMTTNLNAVTTGFGMRFNSDACNQLSDGQTHKWRALPWRTHPISSQSDELGFLTSCTLDVPPEAEKVMVVRNAFSDPLDYAAPSFFGDVAPDLDDELGVHVVTAAVRYGRGRVVLFGDSTVFSSFGLTLEGRSDFLLRTVDWLNYENTGPTWPTSAALCVLVFALLAFALLCWRDGAFAWSTLAPLGLCLGALIGVEVAHRWNARNYPAPTPTAPMRTVTFLREGCEFDLPSPLQELRIHEQLAFDGMFTWTGRLGLLPIVDDLPGALERPALVAIRPSSGLLAERGHELERYVRGGGALMVLSDDKHALDSLLGRFGLVVSGASDSDATLRFAATGADIAVEGKASHSFVVEVERGVLVVTLAPQTFSRAGMGSQIEPVASGDARLAVFDELYLLLRRLVP